jgi:hypothetical protein
LPTDIDNPKRPHQREKEREREKKKTKKGGTDNIKDRSHSQR